MYKSIFSIEKEEIIFHFPNEDDLEKEFLFAEEENLKIKIKAVRNNNSNYKLEKLIVEFSLTEDQENSDPSDIAEEYAERYFTPLKFQLKQYQAELGCQGTGQLKDDG